MNSSLDKIHKAAEGLFFISESDYPFEPVSIEESSSLETSLVSLAGKPDGSTVEKTTLEHFFRNMVRLYPDSTPAQQQTAQQFKALQALLQEELSNVAVYRIGKVEIYAFIIGKLKDGSGYGGLRTKVVET